jgi:hypothetical protein
MNVKEGSGNGAFHSRQNFSQGNMVGGLLYWYSGNGVKGKVTPKQAYVALRGRGG